MEVQLAHNIRVIPPRTLGGSQPRAKESLIIKFKCLKIISITKLREEKEIKCPNT